MKQLSPFYRSYIRSDAWRALRGQALRRAGHRCSWCGTSKRLHVHHRTYKRLGHEQPRDLQVLCCRCHKWADRLRKLIKWIGNIL